MKCWSINDIKSILAITNYHASPTEFRDMIEYSCFDNGVDIATLTSPCWSNSLQSSINRRVYKKNTMMEEGQKTLSLWLEHVLANGTPIHSIFSIMCNSSELRFMLCVSVSTQYTEAGIRGSVWISSKIISKKNPDNYIDDLEYPQELMCWDYPLNTRGFIVINGFVKQFCEILSIPTKKYHNIFEECIRCKSVF